jgi:hypothetical protein
MPIETLDILLEQLKALRIQEDRVIEKITQARAQEKRAQSGANTTSEASQNLRI